MSSFQSGVPNLDDVLGGGMAEGDVLLVVGAPGSGKTTLAFQTAFHTVAQGFNAVFVSTLSESAPRILKHLRSFSFFDPRSVGQRLFITNLLPTSASSLPEIVDTLVKAARSRDARLMILDGLTTIRALPTESLEFRRFVHDLGGELAAIGCTTLLTSAMSIDRQSASRPELTLCDGVIELAQRDEGDRTRRSLRVWKLRGAATLLGHHGMTISGDGLAVHRRAETYEVTNAPLAWDAHVPLGLAELDPMMDGGLPAGSVTLLAGAPGTGKTWFGLQHLLEGVRRGERGLFVGLRETPEQLMAKARSVGLDLAGPVRDGLVTFIHRSPTTVDADELLGCVRSALERHAPTRVVIDSVAELEHELPGLERRRRVMSWLAETLRGRGATTVMAREVGQGVGPELDLADSPLGVLAENVVLLRYVEHEGDLVRVVSVVKMRDRANDPSPRVYTIQRGGLRVSPRDERRAVLNAIAHLPSERRVKRSGSDEPSGSTEPG